MLVNMYVCHTTYIRMSYDIRNTYVCTLCLHMYDIHVVRIRMTYIMYDVRHTYICRLYVWRLLVRFQLQCSNMYCMCVKGEGANLKWIRAADAA